MSGRLPTLFVGHGNPLNALRANDWTRAWASLGAALPRPAAIVAVSAHWYVEETAVTAMASPRTIHDFGGFPRELYEVSYPAPGCPQLAQRLQALLAPQSVRLDASWGLDHGTWSVLAHLYPRADIPVVQLSIDAREPPQAHLARGARLRALREEGVLLLGSGDVVHNLEAYAWGGRSPGAFGWAERFEARIRTHLQARDFAAIAGYEGWGEDAQLSVPTPEHFLPLLYCMGAADPGSRVSFPVSGMDGGSVSMLAVQFD
jgi:4,5-DOPA dioxygenase extradiol